MASTYEIVSYRPELKGQVITLLTHLWSSSIASNTACFEWKYENNPYVKEPLLYLAMDDGQVVGMRGFFGVQWEAGSPPERFVGVYADDMVIAPEYRNRGLIPKIMGIAFKDLAKRGYGYAFNLSAGPVTFLSSLSMGWRSAGSVQPMRWRSRRASVQAGLRRVAKRFQMASGLVDRLCSRWNANESGDDFYVDKVRRPLMASLGLSFEQQPRCGAMAELVERLGHSGQIRHVRDQIFFEWRFRNPLSRYRFLYHGGSCLEGYLVLQDSLSDAGDQTVLNILDWEASSECVAADLLKGAFHFAPSRNVLIWSATLSQERVALLSASGFQRTKQRPGMAHQRPALLVRGISGTNPPGAWSLAGRPLMELSSWDLRMLISSQG
jgi:GNAT superfamily N-acetyltransferase